MASRVLTRVATILYSLITGGAVLYYDEKQRNEGPDH